jgi:hypothetical protein
MTIATVQNYPPAPVVTRYTVVAFTRNAKNRKNENAKPEKGIASGGWGQTVAPDDVHRACAGLPIVSGA